MGRPSVSWWSLAGSESCVPEGYVVDLSGAEIKFYLLSQKPGRHQSMSDDHGLFFSSKDGGVGGAGVDQSRSRGRRIFL